MRSGRCQRPHSWPIKTATRQKHIPLNSYVSLNKPIYDEDSDRTLLDVITEGWTSNPEEMLINREDITAIEGRIVGSVDPDMMMEFIRIMIPAMNPAEDRAMVCGSLAFNVDVKAVLEGFGLREGANSDPKEFVVEKAFVGDGI